MVSIHDALEKAKQEQQARRRAQHPSLTVVPSQGEDKADTLQSGSEAMTRKSFDERLVTVSDPLGLGAEKFRSLCRAVDALGEYRRGCLGITSALRGEGRTTVSANLGVVWAEELGQRVLLIDGDFGHAGLASLFAVQDEPGLADLLLEARSGSIEEALLSAVRPSGVPRLEILPFGRESAHLGQLLASEWMEPFLEYLPRAYSRVLVDFPPVTTPEDAQAMGRIADRTLVVVRAGKTDRKAVRQCLAWLDAARRGNVLGCVLNAASDAENVD